MRAKLEPIDLPPTDKEIKHFLNEAQNYLLNKDVEAGKTAFQNYLNVKKNLILMKYFYNNRKIQDPINDLITIYGIPRLLYYSGKVYQKGGEL